MVILLLDILLLKCYLGYIYKGFTNLINPMGQSSSSETKSHSSTQGIPRLL
jgi:hypothetical protein